MKTRELEYDLPSELSAQHPVARRDESRLLVYDRVSERVHHRRFAELPDVLGDALTVVNDTRVVPARIPIEQPRGEVLLLERLDEGGLGEGLARRPRRLHAGERYGPVELLEHVGDGRWRLRLHGEPAGETPLPPYITEPLADPERYQTVYAHEAGSAAAPTAGLHFTDDVLRRLAVERVTLHVGLDTFRPVAVEDLGEHPLHGESFSVTSRAWHRIKPAPPRLAVGRRGDGQWPLAFPGGAVAAAIGRGEVYVAELGGDAVAAVTLLWDDPAYWGERPPDAAYVHKLAVSRACAGRRIGSAIVEWADATAAQNGRRYLRLDCLRDNPGIRTYYENLGFEHRGDLVVNGRGMR